MVRGASAFYLARELHRRKFFTFADVARMAWQQARFRAVGESLEHVAQVREKALTFVAGHSVAEIAAIGEQVYDGVIAGKLWPGTQALARAHLDAGQRVWLVTATPVEVADVIAHRLGLTGALGTVAEHVDGVYTGGLVGQVLHGDAKADAMRALAAREGLDLSRCAAYSDSANDLPMLSLVGHPCVVNPDAALRRHAREQGWQVRDYRRAAARPASACRRSGSAASRPPRRAGSAPAASADPPLGDHAPRVRRPPLPVIMHLGYTATPPAHGGSVTRRGTRADSRGRTGRA